VPSGQSCSGFDQRERSGSSSVRGSVPYVACKGSEGRPGCQQSASNLTACSLTWLVRAGEVSTIYLRRRVRRSAAPRSGGGRRSLHTAEVTGSIPVTPTIYFRRPVGVSAIGHPLDSPGSAGLGHAWDMLASGRSSVMKCREEATPLPCGSLSLGATACFVHSVLVSSPNAANWVWRFRRVAVATRTLRSAASSGRPRPAARPTAHRGRARRGAGWRTPRRSWPRRTCAG
jgi:hypothetical protein